MGDYTTKPIYELNEAEFREMIIDRTVIISDHALDHLERRERKVYIGKELINTVLKETARRVYMQENGRFAAYYRKKDGFRKIIIALEKKAVVIISFMNLAELPNISI